MDTLGSAIPVIYLYAQSIVGLCVFLMFLYAGLQLMVMGNRAKAQSIAIDAVIGTILLFSSYVILNSINPDLVKQRSGLSDTSGFGQEA